MDADDDGATGLENIRRRAWAFSRVLSATCVQSTFGRVSRLVGQSRREARTRLIASLQRTLDLNERALGMQGNANRAAGNLSGQS